MKTVQLQKSFLKEVEDYCKQNSDSAVTEKYKRYFREGYDSYGLSTEKWEYLNKEIYKKYKKEFSKDDVFTVVEKLSRESKYEKLSLAFQLLINNIKLLKREDFPFIEKIFINAVHNWAHNDFACSRLLPIMIKKKIISLENMASWRLSDFKYQRRAVPVTMIPLLKEPHNIKYSLDFIECMMHDKERVVHQGLGWFLREAWKLHPVEVDEYLFKWRNVSARLIFQYATEKMTKEQRERYRKDKIKK